MGPPQAPGSRDERSKCPALLASTGNGWRGRLGLGISQLGASGIHPCDWRVIPKNARRTEAITAMYETFYGLSQPPFGLMPDIHFRYPHRSYTRAKAYMDYAVMRGEGFLVVTARPGMGKTTLIQDLLRDLGSEQRLVARIDSTQLDADDLLRLVAYAFGLAAKDMDKATLLHNLADFLQRRPTSAGTAILIVDEAQNLPTRSLEELRLITNLQRGPNALIQIFLVGQESLREVIRQPNLEQLQQRVVAACHLDPLDLEETRAYVRHRLLCAGWSGDPTFEAEALGLIHRASAGVPRVINKVCDRLLLYGGVDELHTITGADARLVIEEFQGEFLETPGMDLASREPLGRDGHPPPGIKDLRWDPTDGDQAPSPDAGVKEPSANLTDTGQAGSPISFVGDAAGFHAGSDCPGETLTETAAYPPRPGLTTGPGQPEHGCDPPYPELTSAAGSNGGPIRNPDPTALRPGPSGAAETLGETTRPRTASPPARRGRFAVAAALLLGLGALAWITNAWPPDPYRAQLQRWSQEVSPRIRSLSSGLGLSSQDTVQAPEVPHEGSVLVVPEQAGADKGKAGPDGLIGDELAPGSEGILLIHEAGGEPRLHSTPNESFGLLANADGVTHLDPIPRRDPGPNDIATDPPRQRVAPGQIPPAESDPEITAGTDPGLALGFVESDGSMGSGQDRQAPEPEVDPETQVGDPPWVEPAADARAQTTQSSPEGTYEAAPSASALAQGDTPDRLDQTPLGALAADLRDLGLNARDQGKGVLAFDLAEEIPFDFGSARLPDQAQAVLAPLAQALMRHPGLEVTLVGHTDDVGPAAYNRRLSLARARAVEAYLTRQGVADSRLASRGMGKDAPFPEESNPAAARHRRVEVVVRPAAP